MNSLLLLNGSPRGPSSNSMKFLACLAEGWQSETGIAPDVLHLARQASFTRAVGTFANAGTVIIGMPLYTDCMPGLVKSYIEKLAVYLGCSGSPRIGFVIQSGFAEAAHSRPLERYLAKLAKRLGSKYVGTIVRGGGEALKSMPYEANAALWAQLREQGSVLAQGKCFDSDGLKAIADIERFPAQHPALDFIIGEAQASWDRKFEVNGTWDQRFATPYASIT